jgi:MFS family permease
VFSLSWSVAAFLAPIAGGFVMQHAGNAVLWLGCAVIGAVVALGQILSGPARERRVLALRDPQPSAPTPALDGPQDAVPAPALP